MADEPAETYQQDSGRQRDPELLQVERIVRQFEALPPDAQVRVMAYLAARYLKAQPVGDR